MTRSEQPPSRSNGPGGFDKKHQEVQEEMKVGGVTVGTLKNRVNGLGRAIRLDYPTRSGITPRVVGYVHDDLGRVVSITDGVGGTEMVEYVYKGGYIQEKELGNNAIELSLGSGTGLAGYDAYGRLETMTWNDVGTGRLFKRQYAFDKNSNPTWQKDLDGSDDATARSELYAYDNLNRLTTFKRGTPTGGGTDIDSPARQQGWNLSKEGDWNAVTTNPPQGGEPTDERTHNPSHEIATIDGDGQGADSLVHDRAGNLREDKGFVVYDMASPKEQRYTYDYRNRLLKVERKIEDTWTTVGEYRYDGLNRRVWRKVTNSGDLNGEWVYLYDGWQCIEERDWSGETPANVIQKQYVWGTRYLDELCRLDKSTDTDNVCDDATYYAAHNANWNVTALLNSDGTVAEWYQYGPYGNVTFFTGAGNDGAWFTSDDVVTTTSACGNVFLFQGQRYDSESTLYYLKTRYLGCSLGRPIQRDPELYIDGLTLYQIMRNSPLAFTDPFGLKSSPAKPAPPSCADVTKCFAGCAETYYFCLGCDKAGSGKFSVTLWIFTSWEHEGGAACMDCLGTCLRECKAKATQYYPCCMSGCDAKRRDVFAPPAPAPARTSGGSGSKEDPVGDAVKSTAVSVATGAALAKTAPGAGPLATVVDASGTAPDIARIYIQELARQYIIETGNANPQELMCDPEFVRRLLLGAQAKGDLVGTVKGIRSGRALP